MSRSIVVLIFAAWLATGVGGKFARYAPDVEGATERSERLVLEFLEMHGWTATDRTRITAAGLYEARSFTKANCPLPLRVAVLGPTNDVYEVIVASLGPDAGFLNGGEFTSKPSPTAFATRSALAGLKFSANRVLAPIVVAPAPKPGDRSPCAPPAAAEWARIGED